MKVLHMKLKGPLAELLKAEPKLYQKYVQMDNGQPVMYVKLKKVVYGTLQATLLFWKDLGANLQEWGFTTNPYGAWPIR